MNPSSAPEDGQLCIINEVKSGDQPRLLVDDESVTNAKPEIIAFRALKVIALTQITVKFYF
jgi:hypothetical protein